MPTAVRVLKINGKPFNVHQTTPSTQILTTFLDSSPEDELFTVDQVALKTQISISHIQYLCRRDQALVGYSLQVSRVKYYGNRKAIAELRKQVGA